MKKDDIKEEMLRHEYKTEVFVLLESKLAEKYLGFVSIRKDLDFTKRSLKYLLEIEETDGRPIKETSGKLHIREHDDFLHCLRQSIYFASVITYGKCFASAEGRRTRLEKKDILIDADENLLRTHELIIDIRNQYVAHGGSSDNEIMMAKLLFPYEGNVVKQPKIAYSGASAMSERKDDIESFSKLTTLVYGAVDKKIRIISQKLMEECISQDLRQLHAKTLQEQRKYLNANDGQSELVGK